MNPTKNGLELAGKLAPIVDGGWTDKLAETCSLICRHAATHARLAVEECNGPEYLNHLKLEPGEFSRRWEAWKVNLEKRQERTAERIRKLVAQLPATDEGPITARLGGDPRGVTVKLVLPGEYAAKHDDWDREGICVPGA